MVCGDALLVLSEDCNYTVTDSAKTETELDRLAAGPLDGDMTHDLDQSD